jgi:hypothetical protein
MYPLRHTHYICGFALSDRKEQAAVQLGYNRRRSCFRIKSKNAKWIVLLFTLWIFGCFAFLTTAVTYSFVDCPFFAKLFYLTNWGLLLVYNFFTVLCIFDVSVHSQEYHCCNKKEEEYFSLTPTPNKELSPFNRVLYTYLLGCHFVAFMYTLCIFVLYPMIYFFGGTFDLSFISISAHLVSPLLMFITMWVADLPWPTERTYQISFFASLYLLFTGIHHKAQLSHLGSYPSNCVPSYYYYLSQGEYFVYSQVQFSNEVTLLVSILVILIVLPALSFLIHFILEEIK